MRPMQPTWNRSSGHSPRLSKRWMTLSTSRRLPSMSFSRAAASPSLALWRRVSISTGDKRFSLAVLTPQISTFPCMVTSLCVTGYQKDSHLAADDTGLSFVGIPQKNWCTQKAQRRFDSIFPEESNFFPGFFQVPRGVQTRHNPEGFRMVTKIFTGVYSVFHREHDCGIRCEYC